METEDKTLEFLLRHSAACPPPHIDSLRSEEFERVNWRDAFDTFQEAERLALWEAKSALDNLDWKTYCAARDAIFPLAVSGKKGCGAFGNRAGHKLREAMDATGMWRHLQQEARMHKGHIAFADVCGGPGAFSMALFNICPQYKIRLRGFGMTLRNVGGLDWYENLPSNLFLPTYGIDGTGDIFNMANIEALRSLTMKEKLKLVVADGGFDIPVNIANYQETISGRIIFAQWLTALKLLQRGGCFVLKLFDTFSPILRSILYLSTYLYDRVHVVKPCHSRVVNSERYLVCIGFSCVPERWMEHFERCFLDGFVDDNLIPTLLPISWVMGDQTFVHDIMKMNLVIASNQLKGLQLVLERLDLLEPQKSTDPAPKGK